MESQDSIAMAAIQEDVATIFVSIELSRSSWVIGLCDRVSAKMSLLKCEPGDVEGVLRLVERRRAKLARALGRPVRVISCFEAGYDGFWLDRALRAAGIDSRVIDPASLQVNRRARRAKTDRLDAQSLLRALMAYERGDHEACALVRVPSPAEEDARRPHRERQRLVRERTQHSNRVKGLLATQGLYDFVPLRADRMAQLAALRGRDGSPLGAHLLSELRRELARLALIVEQIGALEAARKAALEATGPKEAGLAKIEQLTRLKAIGPGADNDDRVGLVLATLSTRQRSKPMVSRAGRGPQGAHQAHHHRRIGTQASGRALALPGGWLDPERGELEELITGKRGNHQPGP